MVPSASRTKIWLHYRPGQEDDKYPSKEYCYAAVEAIEAVAELEGIKVDWDHTIQCPEIQMFINYIFQLEAADANKSPG